MQLPTFVGQTIALRPIAQTQRAADPAVCPSKRSSHARSPRSRHHPPPEGHHPGLAGAHHLRWLLRLAGIAALAPFVIDPRLPGLRGEPEVARSVRNRRSPPERRRVRNEGRRDQERSDSRGDGTSTRSQSQRAGKLVLLDRQLRVRLERQAHDVYGALPGRRGGRQRQERRGGNPRCGEDRTAQGTEVHVTGHDAIMEANQNGKTGGPSVLVEALIGGLGALVILFFVFGTLPAVLLPIAIAVSSILNTFTLVWILTYITDVSFVVQFLIALVGLGVAIDYALLMIFRFRDELREGVDAETALVETMTHAGRSVIVSGSTVAVGLLSMLVLPLPFIRSIGIGGMLIPTVSVITAITLLPALLATLGTRINSVRLLPKRLVDRGHPEDGPWGRWAGFVMRHPGPVATVGFAIVALLVFYGVQLNPSEAQAKDFPGKGDAIVGRQALADAPISPGVMKPFVVLVQNGGDPKAIAAKVRQVRGVEGAVAPPDWRKGSNSLVEAFPNADGAAKSTRGTIKRVRAELKGTNAALGGVAGEDRDFVAAVYSNFPYVLGFVVLLTFLLLARAFRSIVLPIKAVVLNLISLLSAYGIIVCILQDGHG